MIPGVGVGLPPPPTFGASPGSAPLRVGGLVHTHPPLGIHNPGMRPLVSLPTRGQVTVVPAMGPLAFGDDEAALRLCLQLQGSALLVVSTVTMSAMHDQLKAQHLRTWLQLIENARFREHSFQHHQEQPTGIRASSQGCGSLRSVDSVVLPENVGPLAGIRWVPRSFCI